MKRVAAFLLTVAAFAPILYFAGAGSRMLSGWILMETAAEAQVHQHGTQTKAGPAEKPAASETAPEEPEAPTVEIPVERQQAIGVKTATASRQSLSRVIRTVGVVEYDQTRLNTINTKLEGWIEKLHVNFTGTYVRKGEPVADIYSPELWATQLEFINALKWAKRAEAAREKSSQSSPPPGGTELGTLLATDSRALVEATRQRLKLWDITDAQIKRIEESENPIRTLTVYSPVSGYVLQKNAVQGMKVMAGEKLFDVADLSTVWITADIYEFELPFIKVGDPAAVRLSYFPDSQFQTKIDYIYPTLQGETRTARARFSVPNKGGRLKPQMFTNVELKINLGRKLAVPEEAVIDTGLRKIVYVDKGNGNFEPREVRTGVRAENFVEVTEGLKAGDKVASSANFLIDSEAKLRGVTPLPMKFSNVKRPPVAGAPKVERGGRRAAPSQPAPAPHHAH
jgi:Cu(I)/Ag(I) efflux system membrane fusion protein